VRSIVRFGLWCSLVAFVGISVVATPSSAAKGAPKIYVAFHWHMHQPIYWPYEQITQTANNPQCTDSVIDYLTWPDRVGAYTHYPIDTIRNHSGLPHMGAQVSFSGSLIENLNDLAAHGIAYGTDWAGYYRQAVGWKTALGNTRLDLVGFGYHHPLMALCDYEDTRRQIQDHRRILLQTFGGTYSKGIFPPENAFSKRMIPALVDEGFEWVLVDNIHFDRANKDYPWTPQQIIAPPNRADQRNPAQPHYEALTCQQNTVNMVSTGFGLRPHWCEYVDPATGRAVTPDGKPARMIVVPTERSIGYDDSYGDRDPIHRLQQLEPYNTDPAHPYLVVLAHDGDNAGASGSRYYLETCGWISRNPDRYEVTTIQDYLQLFPPAADDVIHVEDGSWTGADLGDQEFKKWNGDPYLNGQLDHEKGYSPDRNSWAAITAAKNRVLTADRVAPQDPRVVKAWREFLVGQTSCYWYWDGTFEWDLKPTIASNNAVVHADAVLAGAGGADAVAPTIYVPQREPYNPGGFESRKPVPSTHRAWSGTSPWQERYRRDRRGPTSQPSDFTVWTLVYDVSGLQNVTLKYRVAEGGDVGPANLVYAGGTWHDVPMTARAIPCLSATVKAKYKAEQYSGRIEGLHDALVDYYVEAVDGAGNVARSPIQHVFVGTQVIVPDLVSPADPSTADVITISSDRPGFLHWGVNGWTKPAEAYWPDGTTPWADGKAVDTKLQGPTEDGHYVAHIGPFQGEQQVDEVNFVFHWSDDTWGSDHLVSLRPEDRLRTSQDVAAAVLKLQHAARRVVWVGKQAHDKAAAEDAWKAAAAEAEDAMRQAAPDATDRFLSLLEKVRNRDHGPVGLKLDEVLRRRP